MEEITCVHQYVICRLRRIFDEVDDDFVQSVVTAEEPARSRFLGKKKVDLGLPDSEDLFIFNDEEELGPDGITWQPADSNSDGFSSTAMFLGSMKRSRPNLIKNLATFPARWFRTLVESSNPQRRNMINQNLEQRHGNLGEVLRTGISSEHRYPRREEQPYPWCWAGEDLQSPNSAWYCAHVKPLFSYNLACDTDLRALGYVFWDKKRFERVGLVDGRTRRPCPSDTHLIPTPYTEKFRPSGQERLRELGLA